jgi:hypothetical protein
MRPAAVVYSLRLVGWCPQILGALVVLLSIGDVHAHSNPPDCTYEGPDLQLRELRDSDGATNPGDNGPGDALVTGAKVQAAPLPG